MAWPSLAHGGSWHPGPWARGVQVQEDPSWKVRQECCWEVTQGTRGFGYVPEESLSQPLPNSWRLRLEGLWGCLGF